MPTINSIYENLDVYGHQPTIASPQLTRLQFCFKMALFIINILFIVFGSVLCGTGAYALNHQLSQVAGVSIASGLIVMGSFILALSLLGSYSAYKEVRAGLLIYFVFMVLLTILTFAIAIAVYVQRNNATNIIIEFWVRTARRLSAAESAAHAR
jgi:hypothetical protein